MKTTQLTKLEKLLKAKRRTGVTAMEIIKECGTTAPQRRLTDLKEKGWVITRIQVPGKTFGRYFGQAPLGV